jgi:hypothetical protein
VVGVLIFAAVVVIKGEQKARHRREAHHGLTLHAMHNRVNQGWFS